jgi:hypothetical protein
MMTPFRLIVGGVALLSSEQHIAEAFDGQLLGLGRAVLDVMNITNAGVTRSASMQKVVQCTSSPAMMKEQYNWLSSQCQADLKTHLQLSLWIYERMLAEAEEHQLDHSNRHRSMQMKMKYHHFMHNLCMQPSCIPLMENYMGKITDCYAAGLCDVLSEKLPRENCEKVMGGAFKEILKTGIADSICEKERSTALTQTRVLRGGAEKEFCADWHLEFMMEEFSCFEQISDPQQDLCSPQCSRTWHTQKAMHPHCSGLMELQQRQIQAGGRQLISKIAPDTPMDALPRDIVLPLCGQGVTTIIV